MPKSAQQHAAEILYSQHQWDGTPARMLVVDVQRRNGGTLSLAGIDVYGTEEEPSLDYRWQRELYRLGMTWRELWLKLREEVYELDQPDLLVVDVGDHGGAPTAAIIEHLFGAGLARGQVIKVKGDGNRHPRHWASDPYIKGRWTADSVAHRGKLLSLNVNSIKARLMYLMHTGRVKLTGDEEAYPADIVQQLTSEELVHRPGDRRQRWTVVSSRVRNEAWDQCVYALAGRWYLGPDWRAEATATVNVARVRTVAQVSDWPTETMDHDPPPPTQPELEVLPKGERARRFMRAGLRRRWQLQA